MSIKLIMIRHGKTKGNLEKRYIGTTDEPLCEQGKDELTNKCETEAYAYVKNCDVLFCSPLERCIETAQLILPDQQPVMVEEFHEMDFGKFENKNYQELNGDTDYQAWLDSDGMISFPGGESREKFQDRCRHGMEWVWRYLQEHKIGDDAIVVLVIHGGTIMSLLDDYADDGGSYYDYQCENLGGYLCECVLESSIRIKIIRKL